MSLAAGMLLLTAAPRVAGAVPPLSRVIVIVMENKSYDEARLQPYTASLIAAGTSFSNSHAIMHPSQPNYLALWSGSTQGVTNDNCPPAGAAYLTENLGHACESAGLRWRAYSEDLPSPGSPVCVTHPHGFYTRKHDPWTDFDNLDHSNERPYTDLDIDRDAANLPNLIFVVPNSCNDTHDCAIEVGDAWLAAQVPAMLDSLGPNGMLILTWDEDDFSQSNQILTVFVGPEVRSGYVSTRYVDHHTVLRAICDGLGLAPFAAAASESSITDAWVEPVGVEDAARGGFGLQPVAPNPSDAAVTIDFTVPRDARVRLGVFDVAGRLVASLADRRYTAGRHRVTWDARSGADPGVYFVRLTVQGRTLMRSMVRLR